VLVGGTYGSWSDTTASLPGDGRVTITYTPQPAPAVSTGSAGAITDTATTIAGTVNGEGLATTYHFEYGTTTSYGRTTPDHSLSSPDAQSLSESLSGLAPLTVYHYRVVATNVSGTTNGPDQTFRTSGAPSAATGGTSSVGETVATLGGTVGPNGHPTSYQFEYGPTASYGALTRPASAGGGSSDQPVSATLTGLAPGTVYHYRLVATNASGTTDGADQILTTSAPSQNGGPQNVEPPAVSPPSQHPALTVIGRPTVAHGMVRVVLACRFAPCRATASLTANVRPHVRQTIGSSVAQIRAGARTTLAVSLNAAGRRLLATRARAAARLVVALVDGGRVRMVANHPVTLR
jgi:hypothetical protein